ncbi:hypothetical protein SAMN05720606_103299 [Paenibacillus polysaccharolyticus]|uniref:Uncharacterized protein n=1 Tax=Paenibacillus polysaccharolyticus TaxID=582692 RepID=A0A1G5EH81_9BACL|nr:hypothetical protein [Paenibacillus intestini]SCY26359.1 hypothetical protein SAMN05720606_103299 [Paenibacillus polysaccharolyticus]
MTGPVRENQLRTESKFHLAARIYRGFSPKPTPERPVVYRTVPSVTGHEPDDLIMIINKGGTAEVTNFRPFLTKGREFFLYLSRLLRNH